MLISTAAKGCLASPGLRQDTADGVRGGEAASADTTCDAPTILIVLDRARSRSSRSTGEFRIGRDTRPEGGRDAGRSRAPAADDDARGVIVTTIFRFEDAGLLNDRPNIVVMVDEAHRTQEGRLGLDMRDALPNAKFIGLTGTPISTTDRNTWAMFGDPLDPGRGAQPLLGRTVDRRRCHAADPRRDPPRRLPHRSRRARRSVRGDGRGRRPRRATRPASSPRRASRVDTFMKNPARVEAVCADIVDHYRRKVAPLGLKAQVVAFDRELCVAYHDEITSLLTRRAKKRPS